jgi:AmmeMemoRadiSam system protein A
MKGYYLMPHPPIMIPQVGNGEESKIQKTIDGCKKIAKDIKEKNVDTIIIISPHGLVFSDGIALVTEKEIEGDLSKFRAPQVKMKFNINKTLTDLIMVNSDERGIPTAPLDKSSIGNYGVNLELDHGALVPLYYVGKEKNYNLVHITYGLLSPLELYSFGMAINKAVKQSGNSVALIASGDLSHRLKLSGPYSYSPYGKEFDSKLLKILEAGEMSKLLTLDNKLIKEAGECGLRSLYVLAGAMDGLKVKGQVLSYEGTFGVGYGVVKFDFEKGESLYKELMDSKKKEHLRRMEQGNEYTKLARKSLEYYYENGSVFQDFKSLPKELRDERRGVFVSLKKYGELRGCIGTIAPTTSCVGEEIIRNAISSATADPRFPKVKKEELLEIDISVDILYETEETTKEGLDPKIYGVIVSTEDSRGLLLPNLEGVETVDHQLSIALQKGGISPKENYKIERFKVERYSEVQD